MQRGSVRTRTPSSLSWVLAAAERSRDGVPHEVRALIPGMAASLSLAMCSGTS